MRVLIHFPLDTSHKPIVLSADPEAKFYPSGEKTTLNTPKECPIKFFISSPLYTLHRPIVLSADPEAK